MPRFRTSLAWYARRLAAMSPPEIVYRTGEFAKRRLARRYSGDWQRFQDAPAGLRIPPLFSAMMRAERSEVLERKLRATADEVASGRLQILGLNWPGVSEGPWHRDRWLLDPVTGKKWPGKETFSFDIDYRDNREFGDVKYVWELNRLQFLQPVAVLAARDRTLARIAIDAVLSWMDTNPPFTGINWTSGIEAALRLVTLAIVAAGVDDALTDAERQRFCRFVAAHAFWLERFPSLYSSANNHRAAEGLGLLTAALLTPDAPDSARYLRLGRSILEDAVFSQFHSDGIGIEQSPSYSAFVLEMLSLGALLLRDTPHAFGSEWNDGLARAAGALRCMLDEDGLFPDIGDNDNGRLLMTTMSVEPYHAASVVSLAAAAASRHDLALPRYHASLHDLLIAMPDGRSAPTCGVEHFAHGGYTIVRDRAGETPYLLAFDHGALGFGGLAAHGHADALSIWLHIDGKPVVVDAGTYLYHSGGEWREFFRSTAAHNTMEVDGLNQSVNAGPFNWGHKAQARCSRFAGTPNWEIEGRHDGYRKRLGVEHVRTLVRTPHGFRIEDRLMDAKDSLPVAIRFLVRPGLSVACDEGRATIAGGGRAILRIAGATGVTCRILRGESDKAGPGWHSPAFGSRLPASCIVFEGALKHGSAAITDFHISG